MLYDVRQVCVMWCGVVRCSACSACMRASVRATHLHACERVSGAGVRRMHVCVGLDALHACIHVCIHACRHAIYAWTHCIHPCPHAFMHMPKCCVVCIFAKYACMRACWCVLRLYMQRPHAIMRACTYSATRSHACSAMHVCTVRSHVCTHAHGQCMRAWV